ncbi:mini-chromosome maintenance complex-binding protein [Osmia bicornis bicornis]|uniref:mini-chromosome maintenance complex-binding protein n=1 Tax=Osmia bicornis bicornis TaxID=1437191 RepID=UPI0010F5E517|nr:mini-chromosome maintenance complex-binding protein [Osmia bicornis bicornis]XP_046142365.1 mini-chromosome maintenance complex-binding protein [Osmia bicornis bicornis]XP_046142366.1 mini-chromosome maintenance complex-binding protein [Osmia bicornis bicornis]
MASSVKITDWTPEYYIANKSDCNVVLESANALMEIPMLNSQPLDNFKNQQLIRFRGMIQDMHNPEYYFKQYEVKNIQTEMLEVRCGMYTDSVKCLPQEEILLDSVQNQSSERHTCIVISIPGLNDWAKEKKKQLHRLNARVKDSHKRNLDQNDDKTVEYFEPIQKKERIPSIQSSEKMDTNEHNLEEDCILSKEYILNFPIPIDDGKACIVKTYEDTSLKLNEIIEVVGFISLDPFLSTIYDGEDETMTKAEMNVHHPPASLVPRLHAIKIIHLHEQTVENAPQIMSKAELIKNDLHLVLSQLLFGDHLAADYLICHLLSSVYTRRDYFCLGNYPLNITHFPAMKYTSFTKDLYKFLTLFTEKSHFLEITLDTLNDLALSPKKDYECNRLTSGVLQLSDNTHLVIDETGLTTGQITETGRENYNAIYNLVNFQRVTYDFKFYKMEYDSDIPVLILSEAKSFIPCQNQVVLKIDSESESVYPEINEIAEQYLKNENRLTNIRSYLAAVRKTKFEFNEGVTKDIQNDFIQLRQTYKAVSSDHLHALMILARLLSLSYGSNTLNREYWKEAVRMEMERLSRLPEKRQT